MSNGKPTKAVSVVADGEKIACLRHKLGWTQQELAARSGYSERLVRKLENKLPIRPNTLEDIVQCLHEGLGIGSWKLEDFRFDLSQQKSADSLQTPIGTAASRLREYIETIYVQRSIDRLSEFISPQIQFRGEGLAQQGIQAIEERARALLRAFNPIKFQFERLVEVGNVAIANWQVEMQHSGPFLDIAASGRWVHLRGSFIAEYVEGRCVKAEDQFDVESILRQIRGEPYRSIRPSNDQGEADSADPTDE